jgi:hypothetical protein
MEETEVKNMKQKARVFMAGMRKSLLRIVKICFLFLDQFFTQKTIAKMDVSFCNKVSKKFIKIDHKFYLPFTINVRNKA